MNPLSKSKGLSNSSALKIKQEDDVNSITIII